jgi:hypothetical protein
MGNSSEFDKPLSASWSRSTPPFRLRPAAKSRLRVNGKTAESIKFYKSTGSRGKGHAVAGLQLDPVLQQSGSLIEIARLLLNDG